MENQRKLAPQLTDIRKKYRSDPRQLQAGTMQLYREHGVSPLGGLSGCLPALLQFPILTALYWVFLGNTRNGTIVDHFLFVPHLNQSPMAHPLLAGLPIPALVYLIIPLLAAATTFVQERMMQQAPNTSATEQEQLQQQITRTMQLMLTTMIACCDIIYAAG